MGHRQYAAFMSYSHRDKRWADWLHRALETYRIPKHLRGRPSPVGPIPDRLRPIFRDRDELAASSALGERIEAELAGSAALVVLCSPTAANSRWTNQEIATFKRLHPDRPILAAILEGEPYAVEIQGREEEECFPEALRFELDPDGNLSDRRAEPIAADFRPQGDGKRLGKLKLIAGLLGTGLDELVLRDNARRTRQLATVAAASALGMIGTSALALYAFDQRNEAREQRAEADGLVEFMLSDLRDKLEPVGRLDVLDSVGQKALDYYSRQKLADLNDNELGRRARALHLVGEVADLRGDGESAMRGFREAAASTGALYERDPENWQRVFDHAQSVFWLGYAFDELGRRDEARKMLVEYKDLGERLVAIRPDDPASRFEAASGWINLGVTHRRQNEGEQAIDAFTRAREQFAAIRPADRDSRLAAIDAQAHLASTFSDMGRDDEHLRARELQMRMLDRFPDLDADQEAREIRAYALSNLGLARFSLGQLGEARSAFAASDRIFAALVALDRENNSWQEASAKSGINLAMLQLAETGRLDDQGVLNQAIATLNRAHALRPDDLDTATSLVRAQAIATLAGDSRWFAAIRQALARSSVDATSNAAYRTRDALGWLALGEMACRDGSSAGGAWQEIERLLGTSRMQSTEAGAILQHALRHSGKSINNNNQAGSGYARLFARIQARKETCDG